MTSAGHFFVSSVSPLHAGIVTRIRERGPMTVAEFMEVALYDPDDGYYASAIQRSGQSGDFYTSVDVGPLFGALIAVQLADMWRVLSAAGAASFDLVEAGAGNGRLARDIMDAASRHHPELYDRMRLTLVERSETARRAQIETLGLHASRLVASSHVLPHPINGAIVANELLDALPVHVVTRTPSGLREIGIDQRDGRLAEVEMPLSAALVRHHGKCGRRSGAAWPGRYLAPGERAEIGLAAGDWIREAAAALHRGFIMLFDYTYEASASHARAHPGGTLMAYRAHRAEPRDWLSDPGEKDLTAHVDLGALGRGVAEAGLATLGIVDQTYFLLALGLADRLEPGDDRRTIEKRLAARTLVMPGGLGSTMKAMIFAKRVGRPALRGLSSGRLT